MAYQLCELRSGRTYQCMAREIIRKELCNWTWSIPPMDKGYLVTPSSQQMIVRWIIPIKFNGLCNMVLITRKTKINSIFIFVLWAMKTVYHPYNLIFNTSIEELIPPLGRQNVCPVVCGMCSSVSTAWLQCNFNWLACVAGGIREQASGGRAATRARNPTSYAGY